MKRFLKILLCFIFCLGIVGCNNQIPVNSTTITDLPSETLCSTDTKKNIDKETESFGSLGFDTNNKFTVNERFFNSYHTTEKSFTIEDKTYTQDGHKGEFNIHYPYFSGLENKYEVINSVILAKIVETEGYGADDTIRKDELHYEIKTANDSYVSILFSGTSYGQGAAHPNNDSFTINFDMDYNVPMYLSDIIEWDNNILEKVHSAMKEQWDQKCVKEFEALSADEIDEQLHQSKEAFYLENGKIYIQFSILVGAGFYDFVSFDIEK